MSWLHRERPRQASLDKALVLACWWIVTRSMVVHSVLLGILLTFFTSHENVSRSPSYDLILYWAPIEVWGVAIAALALIWLFTRGPVCIIAGICVALWFFAFASAFLAAALSLDVPSTTVTGWATYGFIGWAWMCVTYVVWKDGEHIREETQQLNSIAAMSEEIEIRTEDGNGNQPEVPLTE